MFETADLGEHLDDLYRFALAITRNPDQAGDLVHDTVVRAIERRNQFRSESSLGAWLRRILHNLAIDLHEIFVLCPTLSESNCFSIITPRRLGNAISSLSKRLTDLHLYIKSNKAVIIVLIPYGKAVAGV